MVSILDSILTLSFFPYRFYGSNKLFYWKRPVVLDSIRSACGLIGSRKNWRKNEKIQALWYSDRTPKGP